MSRFSHCPACNSKVALTEGIDPSAMVRCPACESEFIPLDVMDDREEEFEFAEGAPADTGAASGPQFDEEEFAAFALSDDVDDDADKPAAEEAAETVDVGSPETPDFGTEEPFEFAEQDTPPFAPADETEETQEYAAEETSEFAPTVIPYDASDELPQHAAEEGEEDVVYPVGEDGTAEYAADESAEEAAAYGGEEPVDWSDEAPAEQSAEASAEEAAKLAAADEEAYNLTVGATNLQEMSEGLMAHASPEGVGTEVLEVEAEALESEADAVIAQAESLEGLGEDGTPKTINPPTTSGALRAVGSALVAAAGALDAVAGRLEALYRPSDYADDAQQFGSPGFGDDAEADDEPYDEVQTLGETDGSEDAASPIADNESTQLAFDDADDSQEVAIASHDEDDEPPVDEVQPSVAFYQPAPESSEEQPPEDSPVAELEADVMRAISGENEPEGEEPAVEMPWTADSGTNLPRTVDDDEEPVEFADDAEAPMQFADDDEAPIEFSSDAELGSASAEETAEAESPMPLGDAEDAAADEPAEETDGAWSPGAVPPPSDSTPAVSLPPEEVARLTAAVESLLGRAIDYRAKADVFFARAAQLSGEIPYGSQAGWSSWQSDAAGAVEGGGADTAESAPDAAGPVRRRRKKKPNMIKDAVGIILGGVAGLAIAYYGLNLIGGKSYDFAKVYLPFVQHTRVHRPAWWPGWAKIDGPDVAPMPTTTAEEKLFQKPAGESNTKVAQNSKKKKKSKDDDWKPAQALEIDGDASGGKKPQSPDELPAGPGEIQTLVPDAGAPMELPDTTAKEPVEPAEKPEEPAMQPEQPAEKPEEPAMQPEQPAEKPEEPAEKPEEPATEPKPEQPAEKPEQPAETKVAAAETPAAAKGFVDVNNRPQYTVDDLDAALKTAQDGYQDKVTPEVFQQLCRLGEVLGLVEPENVRDQQTAVHDLLVKMTDRSQDQGKANLLEVRNQGLAWVQNDERPSAGLLFTGKIVETKDTDTIHAARVKMAGLDRTVNIVSKSPLGLAEGDPVVVLGCLARNLRSGPDKPPFVLPGVVVKFTK